MTTKERKNAYLAQATKHFDTPVIRRQALAKFKKANENTRIKKR